MRTIIRRIGYFLVAVFLLLNMMAAFHAYQFTHFYEAQPAEVFMPEEAGFFQKARALLFGVKAYKKPLLSVPAVPHEVVEITTEDGVILSSWLMRQPKKDSMPGIVIMFHGHGGNKAGVLNEASAFYGLGFDVLATDFRAHGNSGGNTCTIGFEEAQDVKAAYEHADKMGYRQIILWGISLGAAAEMKAVSSMPLQPAAMVLEMPFGSLLQAVEARCRLMGVPAQPTATLLTFWGGLQQGFWAFAHDPKDYAQQIHCPVLLQWGVLDNRVSAAETEAIFQRLASPQKTLVQYDGSGHQSLFTSEPVKWINSLSNFLTKAGIHHHPITSGSPLSFHSK